MKSAKVRPAVRRRTTWYRWASDPPRFGMASLRVALRRGWRRVREHPRFPGSWLVVKP